MWSVLHHSALPNLMYPWPQKTVLLSQGQHFVVYLNYRALSTIKTAVYHFMVGENCLGLSRLKIIIIKKIYVQQIVQGFKLWSFFEVSTFVPVTKPDLTLSGVTGLNLDCPTHPAPRPGCCFYEQTAVWTPVGEGLWEVDLLYMSILFFSTSSTKKCQRK